MAEFARLWTTFTGRRVIGLTTATNAARVLASEGLAESYNIAQFLGKIEGSDELRRPVPLHKDDVLVLDEASQLSTTDLAMVQETARASRGAAGAGRRHRAARRGRGRRDVPAARPRSPVRGAARGPPVRRGLGSRRIGAAASRGFHRVRRLRPAREDARRRPGHDHGPRRLDVAGRSPARQERPAAGRVQQRGRRPVPPSPGQADPARHRAAAAGRAVRRQPGRDRRLDPGPAQHQDQLERPPADQPGHAEDHRLARAPRPGAPPGARRDLDPAVPGPPGLPGRQRRAGLRGQHPRRAGPDRGHRPPAGHRNPVPPVLVRRPDQGTGVQHRAHRHREHRATRASAVCSRPPRNRWSRKSWSGTTRTCRPPSRSARPRNESGEPATCSLCGPPRSGSRCYLQIDQQIKARFTESRSLPVRPGTLPPSPPAAAARRPARRTRHQLDHRSDHRRADGPSPVHLQRLARPPPAAPAARSRP